MADFNTIKECVENFHPNPNASQESKSGFEMAIGDYRKLSQSELECKLKLHQERYNDPKTSQADRQFSVGYLAGLGRGGISGIVNPNGIDPQLKRCYDAFKMGALDIYLKRIFPPNLTGFLT